MESLIDHQRVQRFVLDTVFDELLSLQQEISRAVDANVEVTVYPHLGLGGVEFLVHHAWALSADRQALFVFMAFAYVDGSSARCGFELWPATIGGKWPQLHSGEIAMYDADATARDRNVMRVQEFVRNRAIAALRAWRHQSKFAFNRESERWTYP